MNVNHCCQMAQLVAEEMGSGQGWNSPSVVYFDQRTLCREPVCWSKYTTSISYTVVSCFLKQLSLYGGVFFLGGGEECHSFFKVTIKHLLIVAFFPSMQYLFNILLVMRLDLQKKHHAFLL